MVDTFKDKEGEIAQMAIKQYGSIEKYTDAMRKNMDNIEVMVSVQDNATDRVYGIGASNFIGRAFEKYFAVETSTVCSPK